MRSHGESRCYVPVVLRTLIPSMFHRRLLLLLAVAGVGGVPLAWQLGRLSLARAGEHLEAAEARLVRSRQTPTVRGSILDRKGRVLAQDRPSFDLAVDFRVLDGTWAQAQARRAATRSVGSEWGSLSRDEREAVVARFLPVFKVHVDAAWDRLARAAGVERSALDAARDEVMRRVAARQEAVTKARLAEELAPYAGKDVPEKELRAMTRRAEAAIAEREQAHVLVRRVADDVAFACMALSADEVEVELPQADDRLSESRRVPTDLVAAVPGLEVRDSGEREYPMEAARVEVLRGTFPSPLRSDEPIVVDVTGVLTHVLGATRDTVYQSAPGDAARGVAATVGDADRRAAYLDANPEARAEAFVGLGVDRGSYRDGDRIGASGIEYSREHVLRGLRGIQRSRLDTREQQVTPPRPGRDVHLTIDAVLQAKVQALMAPEAGLARVQAWHRQHSPTQRLGDPLYGAAVVLEIDTGDVLAMVSTPTYTRDEARTQWSLLAQDTLTTPLVNRAVGKYYTPGSIVKPLVLVEAVRHGKYHLTEHIACTGHLFPKQPNAFRCWIYKQFGTTHSALLGHDLAADEATMCSCNIFFYTLGQRLGAAGVIEAFESFGVGRTFALGVGGEAAGAVGFRRSAPDRGMSVFDATQTGIGQGPVTWTPMHAANAYATLARGGITLPPRVIAGEPRGEPLDLGLESTAVAAAMAGLDGSVNNRLGTGHHLTIDGREEPIFNAEGVKVWGKTGTADAPRVLGADPDGPGPEPREVLEEGDHSWFVIMVGRDRPRYVIAVVIDFGGSGGKVSGPIANQIVHALIAEGYL
ncbi:MAG: hypothetical protein HBSAPP03_29010 [Phycisphaerae bacterium]|nr:MAG: hypothetical protein HBSAPP03_29010 [Phycisphaerae bacterium]